jgi:DNA-binding transcriptional LysR family regulator
VMGSAQPFDAAHSKRRFTIGAPDALSAIFLPSLIERVRARAPAVDIAIREAFPSAGVLTVERAWDAVRAQLEARTFDVAVIPSARSAPRFLRKRLYDTRFVIAARRGHPFLRKPTLDRFCSMDHVVVSQVGDARGFVDVLLEKQKRMRRVAVTVPNFMLALSLIASTELLGVVPRNLADVHGERMGLKTVELPIPVGEFDPVYVIASRAAMLDAGVAWLFASFEGDGE